MFFSECLACVRSACRVVLDMVRPGPTVWSDTSGRKVSTSKSCIQCCSNDFQAVSQAFCATCPSRAADLALRRASSALGGKLAAKDSRGALFTAEPFTN